LRGSGLDGLGTSTNDQPVDLLVRNARLVDVRVVHLGIAAGLYVGADVVGGIPWIELTDRDGGEHVQWACRLAASTGSRVAMLTDDAGDPSLRTTAMLAEAMIEHGLQGRARHRGRQPADLCVHHVAESEERSQIHR
jgi:hypothetical protein